MPTYTTLGYRHRVRALSGVLLVLFGVYCWCSEPGAGVAKGVRGCVERCGSGSVGVRARAGAGASPGGGLQVFSPEGKHLCTRNDLGLQTSSKGIVWSAVGDLAFTAGVAN
jgi:hypothetical protein